MNKHDIKRMHQHAALTLDELKKMMDEVKLDLKTKFPEYLLLGFDTIPVGLEDGLQYEYRSDGKLYLCGFCSSRKLPDWIFSPADAVDSCAFKKNKSVKKIEMPLCEKIGSYAFEDSEVEKISFPSCEEIGYRGFAGCRRLDEVELPKCKVLRENCFMSSSVSRITAPECEKIEKTAFFACEKLHRIDIPKCRFLGEYVFQGTKVEELNLKGCTHLDNRAFFGNTELKRVSLPVCREIGNNAFEYTKMDRIELPRDCQWRGHTFLDELNIVYTD